jgi:hypothetical protein
MDVTEDAFGPDLAAMLLNCVLKRYLAPKVA